MAANRGVSGIDGVIASACGYAAASGKLTKLLIGDLSALHDLNSLTLVKTSNVPVIVIIINNNGGGIFHHLPVYGMSDNFEEIFATPQNINFKTAAEFFDLPYFNPSDRKTLHQLFNQLNSDKISAIIEANTDRESDFSQQKRIRDEIHRLLSDKLND